MQYRSSVCARACAHVCGVLTDSCQHISQVLLFKCKLISRSKFLKLICFAVTFTHTRARADYIYVIWARVYLLTLHVILHKCPRVQVCTKNTASAFVIHVLLVTLAIRISGTTRQWPHQKQLQMPQYRYLTESNLPLTTRNYRVFFLSPILR